MGALALLALAPAGAQAVENDTDPSISVPSGGAREGQVLTANDGTWVLEGAEVGPPSISRQWRRCDAAGNSCADIVGQTEQTYTLTANDVGNTIRVHVTAQCAGCETAQESSAETPVVRTDPSNDVAPAIAGTPADGQTLTVAGGTNVWSGAGNVNLAYQWLRCDAAGSGCTPIGGATGSSYVLQSADVGSTIRLQVTGSGGASAPQVVTSSPTGGVAAVAPQNVSPPVISGTFRERQTVGGFVGTWSGTAPIIYAVRWQRCTSADPATCTDIAGATDLGYRLQAADVNRMVRLVVTADNVAPAGPVEIASAMSTPVTRRRRPALMSPFPKIAIGGFGRLRGTDVTLFRVTGPPGVSVTVNCRGRRCPFRQVRRRIGKKGRIRIRGLERRLPVGTRIVVRVTASGVIGKYTRFRIRSLKRPARYDACLQPGASRPSRCR